MKGYMYIRKYIIMLLFPTLILAKYQSSENNLLIARADSLFEAGNFEEAKEQYENALDLDEGLISANAGLGKIAIAREDWGEAKDRFDKVLDLDPENLEAIYYRGISYRETGKFKVLLLRKLDWDKSKKYFLQIIERDSSYRDVLFQYAKLLRYKEDYEDAVKLVHRQIRLRPDLSAPQVKLFRYYRYLISNRNTEESISWLSQQPSQEAVYFIGETYRRDKEFLKADSVFQNIMDQPKKMTEQPLLLSLAKLNYAKNEPADAERYFWLAVDSISNVVEADLVFEEMKYVLTDSELVNYEAAGSPSEWIHFFHSIWNSRNPLPASDVNIRLQQHFERLLYAEKYYEYDGFRTNFNNPDQLKYLQFSDISKLNEEYNDKGLIYIRHGEPSEKVRTAGENVPFNESWMYYGNQVMPKMIFHFLLYNSTSAWRLGPVVTHPAMLEDRMEWDHIYYQMLTAEPIEYTSYYEEMARDSRESVIAGLKTDRVTWEENTKPLEIPFYTALFRSENGKTLLELYYAIPLEKLAEDDEYVGNEISFKKGYSLHTLDWEPVVRENDIVDLPVEKDQNFVGVYRSFVKPDSYNVALFIDPQETDYIGGYKFGERVDDFNTDELMMSSIELATHIEPATDENVFVKNGLKVTPNPFREYYRSDPMNIYFEIYNLSKDAAGQTEFSIEYTLTSISLDRSGLQKLIGLFTGGNKSSVTIRADRQGDSGTSVEFLAIDVNRYQAGEYELTVSVTDEHTGESFERTQTLKLH
ncbi:tetratricopeptide repeat protein [candidate division KSB1 bacterium]|nr:tetratricopeptide repeat protein [candidate division KSB1 bacterium]